MSLSEKHECFHDIIWMSIFIQCQAFSIVDSTMRCTNREALVYYIAIWPQTSKLKWMLYFPGGFAHGADHHHHHCAHLQLPGPGPRPAQWNKKVDLLKNELWAQLEWTGVHYAVSVFSWNVMSVLFCKSPVCTDTRKMNTFTRYPENAYL